MNGACFIDVAEMGAAIGSGDLGLAADIEREQRVWLELVELPSNEVCVRQCLHELLVGGALDGDNPHCYVDAFALLCRQLGDMLPANWSASSSEVGIELPFDVPMGDGAPTIALIPAGQVPAALGQDETALQTLAAGRSIITFTPQI